MEGSARRRALTAVATGVAVLGLAAPAAHAAIPVFTPTGPLFEGVVPEAISVSPDGKTVATSDPNVGIALVDITDPATPAVKASLAGTQTAVAYTKDGRYLIVVDQAFNAANPGGPDDRNLRILNAETLAEVRRIPITSGDMIDISPDGRFAAIADEQTHGFADGSVIVIDIEGREPADWTLRTINLPPRTDPRYYRPGNTTMNLQPEYIDIRPDNVAIVSLQDQNTFAVVDLVTGTVQKLIDAGFIDTTTLSNPANFAPWEWNRTVKTARFPDAVTWLPDGRHFLAANEGETDFVLNGTRAFSESVAKQFGGRGYTIYDAETGQMVFDTGLEGEKDVARRGFYPISEADDAGQQFEGTAVARFGDSLLGFAVAERGNAVHIFDLADPAHPKVSQIIDTGARPEYVIPLPERNLLLASGESGGLTIYRVAQPGEHTVIPVVAEDPNFAIQSAYGSGIGNSASLTYDDGTGRVLFNTDSGALAVDQNDPIGPNAKTVGSYAMEALPDGDGGYWLKPFGGGVKHVDKAGNTLATFPDAGTFGGVRIGQRTYLSYFEGVDVYDLTTGQPAGRFSIDIPGRTMRLGDAEATPAGDLLFAVRAPGERAVEIYILRDPETVASGATVTPKLLKKLSLGALNINAALNASFRFAVGPNGEVWIGIAQNSFLELDERLPFTAEDEAEVGGTVPATLSLTLGAAASFGAFQPGVDRTYTASTTATVVSSAGDAALNVSEPGRLANGSFTLAEPLQVSFSKSVWDAPTSNEAVAVGFSQHIGAGEPLRTGSYSKTLTFTLSTTAP